MNSCFKVFLFHFIGIVIARITKSLRSIHNILMLHRASDSNIYEKGLTSRVIRDEYVCRSFRRAWKKEQLFLYRSPSSCRTKFKQNITNYVMPLNSVTFYWAHTSMMSESIHNLVLIDDLG